MTEKDLVNEAISNLNSTFKFYTNAINQTENMELRSAFLEIQNQTEKSQHALCQIAEKLNYDIPDRLRTKDGNVKEPSGITGNEMNPRNNSAYLKNDSSHTFLSSQSNGILQHLDSHTEHALSAAPRATDHTIRK